MLTLMYITNELEVALIAEKYGVQRIWVDLETRGKAERQRNMNTVISSHSVEDIRKIAPRLSSSEMLVRINPWHSESVVEIQQVIEAGAELVMLPMWKTVEEVSSFIDAVNKKAKTVLLLETKEAVECIDDILKIPGIDEIHIGLNDLHISYGLTFMFELLANDVVEKLCRKIQSKGIPFGFGGIARIGEGLLPAEKIVTEHYRLGSTRAILSRSFCNTKDEVRELDDIDQVFNEHIGRLRDLEYTLMDASEQLFLENRKEIGRCIENVVTILKERKRCSN